MATLLVLVGIASVANLGIWQLNRAAEKRAIIQQIAAGGATTHDLDSVEALPPRYQTVRARGRYDSTRQILLDNMPSLRGMPGYRILTPFQLETDGWILVDRGWLPLGSSREVLPDVDVGEQQRVIVGRLDELPRPGVRLGSSAGGRGWPRVMNFPRHAEVEDALERPVAAMILRLDPAQSDGFDRALPLGPSVGPSRHVAYAVQWFALGLTMLIVFVILSFKPKHNDVHSDSP